MTTAAVLSSSELVPLGVFASPNSGSASSSFILPVTGRYESDGQFHYLQVRGDGAIGEFTEPTLSPMSTAYDAIPAATWDTWTGGGGQGIWGTPKWNDDCVNFGNTSDGRPLCNAAIYGVKWFPDQQVLCETWSPVYGTLFPHAAAFGCYKLNESTHTLATRVGCWGMSNSTAVITAGGMLRIPDSWAAANLPAGVKYGIGFGEPFNLGGLSNSHGPDLHAIACPASNDCPATAYGDLYPYTVTGKVLEEHLSGNPGTGPDCYGKVGCTPTQAPTRPYAMSQSWTGYNSSTYVFSWNPWSGPAPLPATKHGWMSAYATEWSMDWYDDTPFGGNRYGVVVPYVTQSGWLNQSVLASPAPTYSFDQSKFFYPVITIAVSSLDTHDGATLNPGDQIWVQGCKPGVDLGCDTANNDQLDSAVVQSVSGNVITAYVTSLDDCISCSHVPPVGGTVYAGSLYVHGAPNVIRRVERLKVCDPNVYLAVLKDPSQADLVQCNDEIDAHALAPFFGCPTCSETIFDSHGQINMKGVPAQFGAPVSVLADPEHRKIRVAYGTAKNGYVVIAVWGVVPK